MAVRQQAETVSPNEVTVSVLAAGWPTRPGLSRRPLGLVLKVLGMPSVPGKVGRVVRPGAEGAPASPELRGCLSPPVPRSPRGRVGPALS